MKPDPRSSPAIPALVTSLGAAVAFALLARAVGTRRAMPADRAMRRRVRAMSRPAARPATTAIEPLGKWWGYGPAALVAATYVARRRGVRAAPALPASAAAAALLCPALDRWLRQREAPPGRQSPAEPVFPSGHALGTSAVTLAGAYVFVRTGLAEARVALPAAAVLPLAIGLGRMHEDKHWGTDVVGGWLAGLAVAAACVAADELLPGSAAGDPA